MRRWLALILLCLLPFQASWAAVANYCQHEEGPAVAHFGHHAEEHQWSADHDDGDSPGYGHHHDHLAGFLALTGTAVDISVPTWPPALSEDDRILPSRPPEQPERPNWPISA